MSPRQSKAGSRSAKRSRGGKSAGRGSSHSGSLSAGRRTASNTRRAAAATRRRGQQMTSARAKRGRGSGSSAAYAVKLLKQDHREVAEALEEFQSAQHEEKRAIAERICKMLTVHAQIEEELLYPAAREALGSDESHLVAEANVEHASVKDLIEQIEGHGEVDEEYEAKVQVMGEYVKHHVREEETELFPKLERSSLDLDALGERLEERKKELMGEEAGGRGGTAMHEEEQESAMSAGRSRGGRGHRSSGLHARRR
jgi:iron-sulfur cluster repair protein YtfE (RIC family)